MTQVRFGLQLPGDDRLHEVQGAVVRCDKVSDNPTQHEIAVFFVESSADVRDALRAWIQRNLTEELEAPGESEQG